MKNNPSNLLVVGSVAYDSIETPFGKITKTLGGSASYFTLAAGYFCKPSVVAVVGKDFKAADLATLKTRADISGITHANGKTFNWSGKYHFDLNTRDTLSLDLGVFENFKPQLSLAHQNSNYVFLGNIAPKLQLNVFKQIKKPKFVGLDTINYWIEKNPQQLKKVLKLVNVLVINDSEARELAKQANLFKASKKIIGLMHKSAILIVKQGEHGLIMFGQGKIFNLPGYPLENVIDPTGAGDSFAGGFMGYIAKTNNVSWENLKRACVAGSVMASFCCEQMGTKGLLSLSNKKIAQRLKEFKVLTSFEA